MNTTKTRAVLMNVGLSSFYPSEQCSRVVQCRHHRSDREYGVVGFFVVLFLPIDSYDFFKNTLLQYPIPLVDYQFRDGFFLHVVASLAAGTCGTSKSLAIKIAEGR